jgi:hypothetical protein
MNKPAQASEQARQTRWNVERSRILAARAKVKRQAEEAGDVLVHALPEPETTPPLWFEQQDDSQPPEHSRSSAGDPRVLTLPGGVLGRPPVANANEPTPEEVFAKAARRETVRRWTGIELPS